MFIDEDLITWLQARNQIDNKTIKAWESHKKELRQKEQERLDQRRENNLCCVCDDPGFPYCFAHDL